MEQVQKPKKIKIAETFLNKNNDCVRGDTEFENFIYIYRCK